MKRSQGRTSTIEHLNSDHSLRSIDLAPRDVRAVGAAKRDHAFLIEERNKEQVGFK